MNELDKRELARLREQQARLETELRQLSVHLASFEQRVSQSLPVAAPSPVATSTPLRAEIPPPSTIQRAAGPVPPPIIQRPEATRASVSKAAPPEQTPIAFSKVQTPLRPAEPLKVESKQEPQSPREQASSIPLPPPLSQAPAGERSFEMRLGTFWLVRVGVVMVLTGLVFFGNLAYQNYISKLGPGGKVSLLYLASACLLGAGWWWQRKAVKETLRNYAQVLFAGGLAALYFTTYAAHHLERLQVIRSATLDGLLLLACAGCMIWAAERKKSEVLALFAVGLAYYTSIITRVGYFTLWSNLVLSGAAVFFLVRNRWAALSFGSVAATYAAYAFWRFFNGTDWQWASPDANLWSGTWFLTCYWLVFTAAVFLSRGPRFAGQNRASFLTVNNGAFFTLFLLTMFQVHQGGFWRFCLIYGAVLLVLAVVAGRLLTEEPLAANAYLTQGLLLVTIGLIFKFSGLQLALVLAAESLLLLVTGQQRKNLVLLVGAYISAALAVGWGMDGLKPFDTHGLWLGTGLGIVMMANTWIAHNNLAAEQTGPGVQPKLLLRPQPSYFAVLAVIIWMLATWHNTQRETFPLVIAVEAVLLTASIYALRIPEVALLSQGVMLFALAAWLFNRLDQPADLPWWNPACMIALSLALSHWWPRQKRIMGGPQNKLFWPALYAFGMNLVLYLWLSPNESGPRWLVITSLVAIAVTAYGVTTRAWFVAAFGQLFMAVGVAQFALQLWQSTPPGRFTLAPIAALGMLSFGTVQWFRRWPGTESRVRDPLLEAALIYRWVALAMSITWICEYVPARERIWVLSLVGLAIFLWAGLQRNREALLFSAAFTATALVMFWLPLIEAPTVYFPNLVAILALLAQRQVARRLHERYTLDPGVHNVVILIGGLSLWLFVSRWILEMANGFYMTASWSVLALVLFTVGLLLRERMYRWLGLGILACALGRVVIFDVWKLETVHRILSFMALGIVLLVLGFIYSKYQEKIREWL